MIELIEKELKHDSIVYFDAYDRSMPTPGESYGRAEFLFCPKWTEKKLTTLYIYHLQQRNVKHFYRVDSKAQDLGITSWTHRGISVPEIWMCSWCEQHQCMSLRVYVPPESNCFSVSLLSTLGIYFGRGTQK